LQGAPIVVEWAARHAPLRRSQYRQPFLTDGPPLEGPRRFGATALATGFARNFRRRRYTVVQWTPSKFAATTASFFESGPRPNGRSMSATFAARLSVSCKAVIAAPYRASSDALAELKDRTNALAK
jgi:hypothetical protein